MRTLDPRPWVGKAISPSGRVVAAKNVQFGFLYSIYMTDRQTDTCSQSNSVRFAVFLGTSVSGR